MFHETKINKYRVVSAFFYTQLPFNNDHTDIILCKPLFNSLFTSFSAFDKFLNITFLLKFAEELIVFNLF